MEIDRYLTEAEHGQRFDYQEFLDRVAERDGVDSSDANYHAQQVMTVVADDVPAGNIENSRSAARRLRPAVRTARGADGVSGKSASGPVRSSQPTECHRLTMPLRRWRTGNGAHSEWLGSKDLVWWIFDGIEPRESLRTEMRFHRDEQSEESLFDRSPRLSGLNHQHFRLPSILQIVATASHCTPDRTTVARFSLTTFAPNRGQCER